MLMTKIKEMVSSQVELLWASKMAEFSGYIKWDNSIQKEVGISFTSFLVVTDFLYSLAAYSLYLGFK